MVNGTLETDIVASMVRAGIGFGLSVIIGVPLGFFVAWYRPINELLNLLLELFRNMTSLALLPVFILVLGIGQSSKIAIILYSCLWPILLNTISGAQTRGSAFSRGEVEE